MCSDRCFLSQDEEQRVNHAEGVYGCCDCSHHFCATQLLDYFDEMPGHKRVQRGEQELEIYVWSKGPDLNAMAEHDGIAHVTEMLAGMAKSV